MTKQNLIYVPGLLCTEALWKISLPTYPMC